MSIFLILIFFNFRLNNDFLIVLWDN
jgi:hypothetical protein